MPSKTTGVISGSEISSSSPKHHNLQSMDSSSHEQQEKRDRDSALVHHGSAGRVEGGD